MGLAVARKFQSRKEDFLCLKCGQKVIGDGYTNHCPACLYSQHVDVNPGDRGEDCGGLMRPIGLEPSKRGGYRILHRCERCGAERFCKSSEQDSFEQILAIMRRMAGP